MIEAILLSAETVFAWVGGIVSCASIIVKLTPTTKDDSVLEKVINLEFNILLMLVSYII